MTTATMERTEVYGGLRIERIDATNSQGAARFESKILMGKAKRAEWIVFRTAERREEHIANRKSSWDYAASVKSLRAAKRKAFDATEHFEVDEILYSSWGYDQTNVNFYRVLKVTTGMVWMVEIGQTMIEGSEGFMSETVTADPDVVLTGEVTRHRVTDTSVRLESYQHAYKWDGKPKYQSHYA